MAADQIQTAGTAFQRSSQRLGISLTQPPIQPSQLRRGNGFGIHRCQHSAAQCRRKREACVGKKLST